MKILQIAPPWINIPPQTYGGTESVMNTLTEELVLQGHDVTLFATKNSTTSAKLKYVYDDGLFQQNQVWSLIQPALALPALLHYDQAFKLAEEGQFDIVHAHLSAGTDIMKLKFLADAKVPVVATAHMTFPFDRWSNLDDEYIRYYAHQANLIFISQALEKRYPANFRKVGVVYNGLELGNMEFKQQPEGHNGQPYAAWLGKILPWKGLHLAIRAAKKARIKFVFAGVMDPSDHESKHYFETQIAPHIDGNSVINLGPADHALKNNLLSNASVFLNPISWDEPFGMTTIESMACGTPVIAFNRGAMPELISSGKDGFIVDDLSSMADAIKNYAQIDRALCRRTVERRFSAKAMTKGYIKMYTKVINGHVAPKQGAPAKSRLST
jgi:glycosyltransferase involved in cell wall biosynthesis